MKLILAILVVVSGLAPSAALAGSTSATMGVGLTIVADCRVSNCAAPLRSGARPRVRLLLPAANATRYLTTRSTTATSPGNITITY